MRFKGRTFLLTAIRGGVE